MASLSDQAPLGSRVMRASGKRSARAVTASISPAPRNTPPLSLKSLKPYLAWAASGQADDGLRGHCLFMTQAEPVIGIGFTAIGQIGLLAVTNVEQVTEHLYRVALLAFTEQGCDRYLQKLAQQVEQGGFHCRYRAWMVMRRSKVCAPRPAESRARWRCAWH